MTATPNICSAPAHTAAPGFGSGSGSGSGSDVVDVGALFLWLRNLDVGSCSSEGITAAMAACRPVRGWLDVLDAKIRTRDRELRNPTPTPTPPEEDENSAEGPADESEPPPPLPGPPAGSGPSGNPLNDSAGIGHGEGRRRDRISLIIDRFVG